MSPEHDSIVEALRRFEDESVVPLLAPVCAEAVRDPDRQFVMTPGAIVFLVNNCESYEQQERFCFWPALTVLHQDSAENSGEVFRLRGRYDLQNDTARFESAEMTDVVLLARHDGSVVWCNPLDGRKLIRFDDDDPDKLIRNAWNIFCGGLLPMLYHQTYRFPMTQADRVRQQNQLVHQISKLYREVIR